MLYQLLHYSVISSIQNPTFPKPQKAGMNHEIHFYRGRKKARSLVFTKPRASRRLKNESLR